MFMLCLGPLIKGGHRFLYKDSIMDATKVRIWDPCPLRRPEILILVHIPNV